MSAFTRMQRQFKIIELLANNPQGLTQEQIMHALGVDRATVSRDLEGGVEVAGLDETGYFQIVVEGKRNKHYTVRPTPDFWRLVEALRSIE